MSDLAIRPEDDQRIRALKSLLIYGNHKENCDRSNEDHDDPNTQHICCLCGWCQEVDWAYIYLGI